MTTNPIDVEKAKVAFEYDKVTGVLMWSKSAHCGHMRGKAAGKMTRQGYIGVRWIGRLYMAHRLIWSIVNGECPDVVDHINGIRSDNKIENLRAANIQINNQNRHGPSRQNKTGFLGVYLSKNAPKKPFVAQIKIGGKNIYLGAFETPEQAHQAYVQGKRRLHLGSTL